MQSLSFKNKLLEKYKATTKSKMNNFNVFKSTKVVNNNEEQGVVLPSLNQNSTRSITRFEELSKYEPKSKFSKIDIFRNK